MRPRHLVKFDIVHPADYLRAKQREWGSALDAWSLEEYRARLNALRSNYSDYYTHPLQASGRWVAEEYYLNDPVFARKVARETLTLAERARAEVRGLWFRLRTGSGRFREMGIAEAYLSKVRPDVIFVRSQPYPASWWGRFRENSLLVARLSARVPIDWHPEYFDLVYTDHPLFRDFFALHGVDARLNDQGFDTRVTAELTDREPRHDLSFVGGLGSHNFSRRTAFLEELCGARAFPWWGYWWDAGRPMSDYPHLAANYRGATSGLEMYQTFRDTRINLNDYVDTADGVGFNQRLFEVLGSGGFLLTREAPNFAATFPEGVFATYRDREDCLAKVDYYLSHDSERRAIAAAGEAFIRERYDFSRIAAAFERDVVEKLEGRDLTEKLEGRESGGG